MQEVSVLADLPRVQAATRGDRTALVFAGRTTTWSELDARSSRVANALRDAAVGPDTRVAFLARDSDRIFEAQLGVAKAGAVIMGVNWRLSAPEIAWLLEDSGAEVLFVGRHLEPRLAELRLDAVRLIVSLDGGGDSIGVPYEAWRDAASPVDPALPIHPEAVAVQMYTSGTTGHPKGVMLANRSFFAVVRSMRRAGDPWIGLGPDDVALFNIPSFHIGGLWWAATVFEAGAKAVVMEAFQGWQALELIASERITKLCMVPAMLQMCLAEPTCATTDFSSLTHVIYGGSPIPRALLESAMTTFGAGFVQIYGLTETGNTAVCLRPEDHADLASDRIRAAGRPYPDVELKVIDAAGRTLAPHEVGEICIKSPANMVGYWNRPEATAETLVDGWVHTGDAGSVDEAGYVRISDRVKDMIIYAGENLYPAEIENALASHPAVHECAVIGVPDDRWGELVKALVVLAPGAAPTRRDLIAHVRRTLADFKVPKSIDFVASLPRTPSGKVKKAELRRPFWAGRERQV